MDGDNQVRAVFVYGTLRRGGVRERCWPRAPQSVEPATMRGTLYDLGPYPALVAGNDVIAGELWTLREEDMAETLRVLDEVECFGVDDVDLYVRVAVTCWLESDGAERSAYCYFLANPGDVRDEQRIGPDERGVCRWVARGGLDLLDWQGEARRSDA